MTIALELQQLKKTYPGGVQALRGIDLQVEAGDFYALLGPNGAGKSTTIGIISSLVNKTSGRVSVFAVSYTHLPNNTVLKNVFIASTRGLKKINVSTLRARRRPLLSIKLCLRLDLPVRGRTMLNV